DGALKDAVPYKPIAPERLYLSPEEVLAALPDRLGIDLTAFDAPEVSNRRLLHAGSRTGRSFEHERADPNANVFDAAVRHIGEERAAGRRVIIAGWTEGSLDRLGQILTEHHL